MALVHGAEKTEGFFYLDDVTSLTPRARPPALLYTEKRYKFRWNTKEKNTDNEICSGKDKNGKKERGLSALLRVYLSPAGLLCAYICARSIVRGFPHCVTQNLAAFHTLLIHGDSAALQLNYGAHARTDFPRSPSFLRLT